MKIGKDKKEKILEQILLTLYHEFPKSLFTSEIANKTARDEEFVKSLMFKLKEKGLVVAIKQNPKGVLYSRRICWRLSKQAHQSY